MTDEATIKDVDGVETRTVSSGGQVYLSKKVAGQEVTFAWRVEDDDEDDAEQHETQSDS